MDGKGLLWRISSLFVLLQITSSGAVTYADYDIASDRVCSRLGKRELSISMSRPVLVREGGRLLSNWPGKHFFSCRFEIEAKGRGLGAVAVVQKLKLRKLGMECVDYLQFKEDKETNRGPRLCGSMMFGHQLGINNSLPAPPPSPLPPLPPSTENTALSILSTIFKGAVNRWSGVVSRGAVVDPKGELKTYVYVDNRALRPDETLELVVAYTGYQECDGRKAHPSLFHCGYGLCVSSLVVNDGVVNCPFGDCADEVSCSSAMASNLTAWILRHSTAKRSSDGVSTGVTATSSFFAIAILMTIGACICFILRRNKKRKEAQLATEGTVYHQQNGNGEYVGVPTMAGGQTMGAQGDQMMPPSMPSGAPGQPMMPPSQPEQQPGGIGFRVPGSNDQPYPGAGAPYPGAGAPYPGAGAPYPGAGAPYPGAGAPYPGTGAPYPGAGAPYPGAGTPYPGAGTPYPGAGTPYPGGNTPYPVQPPPSMPPPAGGDASAPTAPASQESPPPYTSLFPQPKN